MARITVVGLGPGEFGLLTLAAWDAMKKAAPLRLRTAVHPTAEAILQRGVAFTSYDAQYERAADFDALYRFIVDDLLARAKEEENLVYAVPGSPFVAERTVQLLRERAEGAGVELLLLPGMSFAELFYSRLGIDPIDGLVIVDAGDVAALPARLPMGCIVTQVYSPAVASETKLSLMERFPDEYEIVYAHHLGLPEESLRRIPLYALDRQVDIDHLTSLYLPPWGREENKAGRGGH
ncbi:MAG: SAM-dependent methyltransferase [Schwartzia sp. (in: firmicutes)]